ncbi:MAG: DNA repair protein RecN [Pseudomonadota bacterium]
MLRALDIRDIVLIERLDLGFQPGLNVLTGETGAGKSILLDALGFALGRKGRHDMVRAGAAQGSVTAVFEVPADHAVHVLLDDLGLSPAEDGELILRRVQAEGGPARGFVNDGRASADAMARIGAALVEVHGQRDDRGLLDPKAHRGLLDAYGGYAALLTETAETWRAAGAAEARLSEAREVLEKAAEDADYLRHSVAELEKLAPEAGEDAALDTERRRIKGAARLIEEIGRAAELISPQADGAVAEALDRLARIAEEEAALLSVPVAALDRAMVELGEAQRGVAEALEALDFDPGRLDAVEERLFAIRALARKHQVAPDALADLATDMTQRLDEIDGGAEHIAALEIAAGEARRAYDAAASRVSQARRTAAETLDQAIGEELAPLRMEKAVFRTEISAGTPGPEGTDAVRFTAATNPGTPPGPIDRIASGGELSRFLLAMKVCLAGRAEGLTMIFDEIDRGVGGATAAAVGRRLGKLAEDAQVLVVTHSPQVAAEGAHHWHIAKTSEQEATRTEVRALAEPERLDEIARMLAGEHVTEEARSAARALMQQAGT